MKKRESMHTDKKPNMNIFFLHWNPRICARWHLDKHVVKMILESCQLLCGAHWMTDSEFEPVYKITHKNHPCAKWVRESLSNYKWLVMLTAELCSEYTYRYERVHKCQSMLKDLISNLPPIVDNGLTYPARAMPDKYKKSDPMISYRLYYLHDKTRILSWKKRDNPPWSGLTDDEVNLSSLSGTDVGVIFYPGNFVNY